MHLIRIFKINAYSWCGHFPCASRRHQCSNGCYKIKLFHFMFSSLKFCKWKLIPHQSQFLIWMLTCMLFRHQNVVAVCTTCLDFCTDRDGKFLCNSIRKLNKHGRNLKRVIFAENRCLQSEFQLYSNKVVPILFFSCVTFI